MSYRYPSLGRNKKRLPKQPPLRYRYPFSVTRLPIDIPRQPRFLFYIEVSYL
ncbi:hypothetical protein [Paenibacillus sp. GP183]|uniref:hypothetical protein n=1 Tax=Paenibacillus sp. GP183 TaxID=1882751 RepID=UPI0014954E6E|nr:hypothetical protein [Paenibacillus sp. GP183]